MRRIFVLPALLLLVAAPAAVRAQSTHLPTPVTRGLALLQADSVHQAVQVWAAAWTSPVDAGKSEQLETAFAQLGSLAGQMHGYDVIAVDTLTPHLLRVYTLLRYSVPVYTQFVVYDRGTTSPDWMVATVRFHTDPTQALPNAVWKQ